MMRTATALLLALIASCAWAETITGRVIGVADGDTITVLDAANQQHKIRLSGIDCPEKNQPFGQVAKQSMSDQVFDQTVRVDSDKRDRYGRVVGQVWLSGVDVNLEQIKRGLAWHYKKYQNEQPLDDRLTYTRSEDEAHAAKRGLWADTAPVAPWDWRKQ